MTELLIERLQSKIRKPHRTHRNILDQDSKFLDAMVDKYQAFNAGEEVNGSC